MEIVVLLAVILAIALVVVIIHYQIIVNRLWQRIGELEKRVNSEKGKQSAKIGAAESSSGLRACTRN